MTNLKTIILQAPFVIVEGIATRLYMPERNTLDLDILILSEDALLVYQDLERAKSRRIGNLSIPGSQWQLSDGTSLDVIESTTSWATEAIANPNYAPDGLPIIALPYLVLMKLTASRSQDLADISRMMGGTEESQLQEVRRIVQVYLPSAAEDLESLITLGKLERETDEIG
ncbi:hypothetical protein PJF56_04065 [Roseofilum sp. BLCC_M91]|uniref:Uncharacterized protein n=1 Tax=Roseofilum halophilum BLCC-M91 TaxID=3022259 RepID=A0ABT7BFS7_9CYAN|nr:hypothetical protein [Roseofilum halophilum]MDJ1178033.1 hypothetical protein [Roseofilum halophilum BLCC-M91]